MVIGCMVVTSSEHRGASNHRHLDCMFNGLFIRITKKTSEHPIFSALWGETMIGFSSQSDSNTESVFILWRHNGLLLQDQLFVGHATYKALFVDSGTYTWPVVTSVTRNSDIMFMFSTSTYEKVRNTYFAWLSVTKNGAALGSAFRGSPFSTSSIL